MGHSSRQLSILADFNGTARNPQSGVVEDSAGNLYGTTLGWGYGAGYGTIYEWVKSTGTITVIARFNNTTGSNSQGRLIIDNAGNLFGENSYGGFNYGSGTLFEWVKSTGTITVLATFDGANGAEPMGGIVADSSGNLFGRANASYGVNPNEMIFEWIKSTDKIVDLADFSKDAGIYPYSSLLLDSSGNLFGTNTSGGTYGYGSVFKWVKSTRTIVILADFQGANGAGPNGTLVEDANGNLYGTTSNGGNGNFLNGVRGYGTVFEWNHTTGTLTDLVKFAAPSGASPAGGLLMDRYGNLFGTTSDDGSYGFGTIFEWIKSTDTLVTLANFNGSNGVNPNGGLVEDADGNLFRTTFAGGKNGVGTLFEWVKSTGTIVDLLSFDYKNGAFPAAGLIQDSNGNFFGTASSSGIVVGDPSQPGYGTIFEWVKRRGTLTVLARFDVIDGASPSSTLAEDSNGNLFGTAGGGANSQGTLFEWVKSTGKLVDLHDFSFSSSSTVIFASIPSFIPFSWRPSGAIVVSNGNIFGTTYEGGDSGAGSLFEWIPSTAPSKPSPASTSETARIPTET
jgi:uncharacterized repeat protein (TIGR03803 family)